jgi:HPt (histidine-containing phosphotransfer) domain-containing protein
MTISPTPPLYELLNMPDLLARIDDDRELLQELFQLFRVEFPRLQVELQEALATKNMQQTVKTAHMLKGMLANLSFECAATAAETLEHMAVMEDQPGTERALVDFNSKVLSLLPSLNAYLAKQKL